jgi:DNA-binding GntR family transcriptional regulator
MASNEFSEPKARGYVERAYKDLKWEVTMFRIPPGGPLNIGELSGRLNISRTPIREALNRLVTEHLITLHPNRGFFNRTLAHEEIASWFELSGVLELAMLAKLSTESGRASLSAIAPCWISALDHAMWLDEQAVSLVRGLELFHERLISLSANNEALRVYKAANTATRFVRWIYLRSMDRRAYARNLHVKAVSAAQRGDSESVSDAVRKLTLSHAEALPMLLREGVAELYLNRDATALETMMSNDRSIIHRT